MPSHDYAKELIVGPGNKVRLKDVDPGYHGEHESHKHALPEIQVHVTKIDALQYLMYAEGRHALLIVLQGLDGAGKCCDKNTVWIFIRPTVLPAHQK